MHLRQIEAFRSVMLSGGITAAAAMMRISQPSVSRLIGDLERAVGFPLFVRRGRQLYPTKQAEIFFDVVRRSYTGLDLLEQAARRIRAHPVGTIRVASLPNLAGCVLPEAVRQFHHLYPDIKVTVEAFNQQGVEDRVFLGQADFGLGVRTTRKDGLRVSALADAEYVCVLPPGHRLARCKTVRAADLNGEQMIGPMHESEALWDDIDRMLVTEKVDVQRSVEVQMSFPSYCFVTAGLGLMIAEPFSAPLFAQCGVVLRRFRPKIHSTFTLVEANGIGPASKAVAALQGFIRQASEAQLKQVDALCRDAGPKPQRGTTTAAARKAPPRKPAP